jgi:hypothetical protein
LNLPANIPLNFVAVRQMTVEGQPDKMASDMEVRMKQRCVIEFLHAEKKNAPSDIHLPLLNDYQTVDVRTFGILVYSAEGMSHQPIQKRVALFWGHRHNTGPHFP